MKRIYVLFISILFIVCGANYDKDINQFYNRNNGNESLLILEDALILPRRGEYELNNNIVFSDYDIKNPTSVVINSDLSNEYYITKYFSTEDSLKLYVHKYYSIFKELELYSVFGNKDKGYIKLYLSNRPVLIFIVNQDLFNYDEFLEVSGLQEKDTIFLDKNWFYYILTDEQRLDRL